MGVWKRRRGQVPIQEKRSLPPWVLQIGLSRKWTQGWKIRSRTIIRKCSWGSIPSEKMREEDDQREKLWYKFLPRPGTSKAAMALQILPVGQEEQAFLFPTSTSHWQQTLPQREHDNGWSNSKEGWQFMAIYKLYFQQLWECIFQPERAPGQNSTLSTALSASSHGSEM